MKEWVLWTDGSCLGNPGPGGWAYMKIDVEQREEVSGGESHTTNNRMELKAVIEGLKTIHQPASIKIYTDSKYVSRGMTEWVQGWVRRSWRTSTGSPVLNVDLWKELLRLTSEHRIEWIWVRAHNQNALNERVDYLARQAAHAASEQRGA